MSVHVDGLVWVPNDSMTVTQLSDLRSDLIVRPKKTSEYKDEAPPPIFLFREKDGYIGIPRAFYLKFARNTNGIDLSGVSDGAPFSDEAVSGGIKSSSDPIYAEQDVAVASLVDSLKSGPFGGAILRAATGTGKTIMALKLAYKLGRRTLVIVNKDFFVDQWTERIQEFIPGAKIGVIQQERCDWIGKDIVIGMVHSLAQRTYPKSTYDAFGLVITDEVHGSAAQTFSSVVPKFTARYRLGLSATVRRRDGAENVFFYQIGPIAYRYKSEAMIPKIKRYRSSYEQVPYKTEWGKLISPESMTTSQLEKQMSQDLFRNKMYAEEVCKAAAAGRKVMVVSKFVEHLWVFEELLRGIFKRSGERTIGWVTGQKFRLDDDGYRQKVKRKVGNRYKMVWKTYKPKKDELKEAESAQILLCTQQMIAEGFDVPAIDALVHLIAPGDMEQVAGRARRFCKPSDSKCDRMCPWRAGECRGKKDPVILETVDPGSRRMMSRHRKRMEFYRDLGAIK